MKRLACIPRCHRIVKLALILASAEICALSAEPIDFPALDRALHSVITNRQTSDTVLLQAISRLGPVTEPPSFWWNVIEDSSYSIPHRTRALHALFRRHCETRGSVTDLRNVLGDGKWLHEAACTKVTYVFGWLPVEVNEGESVFMLTVFGSARIYIQVLADIDEEAFAKVLKESPKVVPKVLRPEASHQNVNPAIIRYGYQDDYDRWYYRRQTRMPEK
jgi:hypothetical protein